MVEKLRSYGIVGVFFLLFTVLTFASPVFLSRQNAANILDQNSALLILAATSTLCIITGIFDLSVAAVATASAIATVQGINAFGMIPGLFIGVFFGAFLGLITGLSITLTKVNSFIGTLAASFTYRGLGLIMSQGDLVTIKDSKTLSTLTEIVDGRHGGLKGAVYIALAFVALLGFLLWKSSYGKQFYAVGGNSQAAFLAGIRTNRVAVTCYVVSGLGAGIVGAIYASTYGSGATNSYSDTFAFTAIAATVVGGVSIFGGQGAIWRGQLGILTFALIGNGLNLLGVDTTYQLTILGLLIFFAVASDQLFRNNKG